MRIIWSALAVVAVYVGLVSAGITGAANGETLVDYSNSAKAVGNVIAEVQGDGLIGGPLSVSSTFENNSIDMEARGQGEGELAIRVRGSQGFSYDFNLELDPLVQRRIIVKVYLTERDPSSEVIHIETSETISVILRLNTVGVTGKVQLSVSCSGSFDLCLAQSGPSSIRGYPRTLAFTGPNPGNGRVSIKSVLDVYQN